MTIADLRAIAEQMRSVRARVEVGVPEGPRERGGASLAKIASVHEFGALDGRIPERSFLRAGIQKNLPKLQSVAVAGLTAMGQGKMDADTALGRLGAAAVGAVKLQITNGDYVPLKPATIRRKKSSKPLIDTGNLRQSITYEVVKGVS